MQPYKSIIKGLLAQKTRSALTASATICATCMITCLIAFYHMATATVQEEINTIRNNTKVIMEFQSHYKGSQSISQSQFLKVILPNFKQYQISSAKRGYTSIHLDKEKRKSEYFEHIICDWRLAKTYNLKTKSGRFFHELEFPDNNFAVIGHSVAEKIKAHTTNITDIFINGKKYNILGILEEQDNQYFFGKDNINHSILTHFNHNMENNISIDEVTIQIKPNENEQITKKIEKIMQNKLPKVSHQIIDMSKTAQTLEEHIKKIKFILIAIGSMSTIIAIVNIINGMHAIINERQEEIGIRLSIGATPLQIKLLLLSETLVLSLVSSIIGIGIGEYLNFGLIRYLEWDYQWRYEPGLISVVTINLINIAACYLPLRKINTINPIKVMHGV
ncbi:MAG: ABC transporter permease [Pseudomonadota bacterium]|nr:ABC transporter permease [Pseudomonadota bacterium]